MCVEVDEATQNGIEIDNEINGHKTPWHISHIKFTLYEFYACALSSKMQHIPHYPGHPHIYVIFGSVLRK